jgi:thioredoxin 1
MSRNAWLHADERPTLLFFSSTRSGPARRMSSLVAWVRVTEKARLRVLTVDTDRDERLMRALGVSAIPALVLVRGRDELGRLEGRATGRQIERLIRPHVAAKVSR